MLRGQRSHTVLVTAALLLALAGSEAASAGTSTVRDGNDARGVLDVRSLTQGHSGANVTHTIRMFGPWSSSVLAPHESNAFVVWISTDSDPNPERFVLIQARSRLVGIVFRGNGGVIGKATVSRPDRRSVRLTISKSRLGNPAAYRWQAFTSFLAPGGCSNGCVDRAPNGRRRVLHDLRAPTVSFPQPPPPAGVEYDLDFTVADAGRSGLDFWRLQHRDDGAVSWRNLEAGSTRGSKNVTFTATMAGDVDEFRVVAVDGHGNRTVSPVRAVTAGPYHRRR